MFTPYHPSAVFCYGFGMTNDPIHLSVVIPAFNEEKKIAEDISIATDYLDRQSYVYEIIVVDDGSRDRTADVARDAGRQKPQVRVILQPGNLGKGAAVRTGMQAARGAFAVFADAGACVPYTYVERGLQILVGGEWQHELDIADRHGETGR